MRTTLFIAAALALRIAGAQSTAPADGGQGDLAAATPDQETERLFHEGEKAARAGDATKAISLYGQVLERDPDHLNALLQRGACHIRLKDHAAAVADFTAVIQRKSDHQWAYTSRGCSYLKLGKTEEAIRDLDIAIGLDAKDQEAWNNRGWAFKAQGRMDAACRDWKTSKKMGNAEARIILENNRCK